MGLQGWKGLSTIVNSSISFHKKVGLRNARRPSVLKANTWLYVEQSMENSIRPVHDLS